MVLIRIRATGICGSDVHVYHGGNPYAIYPRVIGHEASGEVEAVGSGVTDLKTGDGVVFEPMLGTRHQYQKFPEVTNDLPKRLDRVDKLVTHIFKADEFKTAFAVLEDKNSTAAKVVLTFD